MANDNEHAGTSSQASSSGESSPTPVPESVAAATPMEDRSALLDRARAFLTSPNVIYEEPVTKRRFLAEKGLNDVEIEGLMRELPAQHPVIPPRTYPQPPPSNLPHLLMGLMRIFTWLTGGSAVLMLLYYRFLLPRLTRSALARRSLKQHQISLLTRLNGSLAELKSKQAETFAVLSVPRTSREPSELAEVHSLEKLSLDREAVITIPTLSLLRCAIEGLAAEGKKITKEELFSMLEERYSWLKSNEGIEYQHSLWETLTTNPSFSEITENERLVWVYTAPTPPAPTALETSLTTLKTSFPPPRTQANPYQRTLEALGDFTGYITTQTYQLASSTMRVHGLSGIGGVSPLSPQQEEIRKEIRALKGLVLNRRTFAPTAIRPPAYHHLSQTP